MFTAGNLTFRAVFKFTGVCISRGAVSAELELERPDLEFIEMYWDRLPLFNQRFKRTFVPSVSRSLTHSPTQSVSLTDRPCADLELAFLFASNVCISTSEWLALIPDISQRRRWLQRREERSSQACCAIRCVHSKVL